MFRKNGSKLVIFCRKTKKSFQILSKISTFVADMAGLYIHIPFCKTRCIYCGFFSTTMLRERQNYVDAIVEELKIRNSQQQIETIYLGGGTPSLLQTSQLRQIFGAIYHIYNVSEMAEVTIECNPDDVTKEFADCLSRLPVNRVSMGAQTFDETRLRFLRRRHTPAQVALAVELLRKAKIENIGVDLIYGFPNERLEEWKADIDAAMALDVEHLSAYALSYEKGTELFRMKDEGRVKELDEELQRTMYDVLIDKLTVAKYEHYELSNFARKGFRSRHNSSYWKHIPYIGIGAGAHSFDGKKRQWNTDDLLLYIQSIQQGRVPYDTEELDENMYYNELVMTELRTCEGLYIPQLSSKQRLYCLKMATKYLDCGWLIQKDEYLRLTQEGLFVSDLVMSDLMMV